MKILIALLALVAVALGHHEEGHHEYVVKTHQDLLKFRDECVEKLSVPAEMVEKFKKWEYPDEEKSRCYMKCVFEKFGFFSDEHGFDVKNVHHQLGGGHEVDHSDDTHQKIESCADKNTQGSDTCTWAYRGGTCFIKNNLQLVQHSVKN